MRPLIYFALVGTTAVAAKYATVPNALVNETIYNVKTVSVAGNAGTKIETLPALTSTRSVLSTQIIHLEQASTRAGLYSFTENNGTVSWMGNTPPASASLIIKTSTVSLKPVPDVSVSASNPKYPVTLSSTKYVTETSTETFRGSLPTSVPYANKYIDFGAAGWNATLVTSLGQPTSGGLLTVKPSAYKASAPEKIASRTEVSHVLPGPSVYVLPDPSFNSTGRRIKRRQLGHFISATIDGVAVSWKNNYGGGQPTSVSRVAPIFVPVTATAPRFGTAARSIAHTQTRATGVSPSAWGSSLHSVSHLVDLTTSFSRPSLDHLKTTATFVSVATGSPHTISTRASAGTTLTPLFSNSSAASDTATAANSSCGNNSPRILIDFDDLPSFSTGPDDTDIPPIFNPYYKLYWEGHFGYVPPPTDPFPPHSFPQLAVYRGSGLNTNDSNDASLEGIGGFGAGPRADLKAYWIDAESAWLGCANGGPGVCTITIVGHQGGEDSVHATQIITQPPCLGLQSCSLALVEFDNTFRNLTRLQIIATVGSELVDYFMDDLRLSWSDNSCDAQILRSSSE